MNGSHRTTVSSRACFFISLLLLCSATASHAATTPLPPANMQLEGKDQGRISLSTTNRNFTYALSLQTTNATIPTEVRLTLDALNGPHKRPATLTFEDGERTKTIADYASAPHLLIEAELLEAGSYLGRIQLSYASGDTRTVKNYELQINKSLVAATLTATPSATVPLTLHDDSADVSLTIDVKENGERQQQLERARLHSFKRVDANNADWGVEIEDVQFKVGGLPITPDNPGTHIELDGGAVLELAILGIDTPGHYQGVVAIEVFDRTAIEASIVFMVRKPWWSAALLVFCGIVVSWLLRIWGELWQPRLTAAMKASSAVEAWTRFENKLGALDEVERELTTHIRGQLLAHFDSLRISTTAVSDTFVDLTLRKQSLVTEWINAKRLLDAQAYEDLDLREQLGSLEATLRSADVTDASLTKASEDAQVLETAIHEKAAESVNEVSDQLAALSVDLSNAAFHDVWQRNVANPLEEAKKHIADGALAPAEELLRGVRGEAATILAADLNSRKTAMAALILGPKERSLLDLSLNRAQQNSASSSERIEAYQSGLGLYLIGVAAALDGLLNDAIEILSNVLEQPNLPNPPEVRQRIAEVQTHRAALKTVPLAVRSGDMDGARTTCTAAGSMLEPAVGLSFPDNPFVLVPVGGGRAAATRATTPGIDPLLQDVLTIPIGEIDPENASSTTRSIRRWLTRGGFVYNFVVIVIATGLGVLVLWADNAQWGSTGDVVLALFWGLGLHGLATSPSTYEGLTHLAGRLR